MTDITIDVTLDYALAQPGAAILVIEAAGAAGQELHRTSIDFGPLNHFARVPGEEGVGERIVLRTEEQIFCRYSCDMTVTRKAPDLPSLQAHPVETLPGDALRYLLPSRYCEAERFFPFVTRRFGELTGGLKVAAIRNWIEDHLQYVPGASHGGTTAADTFLDGQGVCRDYAHLMIAMCRAAQIPARMCSVYAPSVQPPDFHAVVEVFLSGEWHLVDPSGMASADQMALIAVGRDATDVAFLTTISNAELRQQRVSVTPTGT